jgi:cytochrome P450
MAIAVPYAEPTTPVRSPLAPGPRGAALWPLLLAFARDPLRALERARVRYGDVVHARLGPGLTLLFHPSQIQHVLQRNAANYHKAPGGARARARMTPLAGSGTLFDLEDAQWLRERKHLQPAFHSQELAPQLEHALDAARTELERVLSGAAVDVGASMRRMVTRAMTETFLGGGARPAELVQRAVELTIAHMDRRIDVPAFLPTPANRKTTRALSELDALVFDVIRSGRRAPHGIAQRLLFELSEPGRPDEPASDAHLRDHLVTFVSAGSHPTSYMLVWAWALLTEQPHVVARIRSEVERVCGRRELQAGDIPSLSYTRQVLLETLRLYPPGWNLGRKALRNDVIDGYAIPAGSLVLMSPFITQRHPAVWRSPLTFDPDRFERPRAVPRFALLAFGAGQRSCIGSRNALGIGAAVLATWLQRATPRRPVRARGLRARAGHTLVPEPELTLHFDAR